MIKVELQTAIHQSRQNNKEVAAIEKSVQNLKVLFDKAMTEATGVTDGKGLKPELIVSLKEIYACFCGRAQIAPQLNISHGG